MTEKQERLRAVVASHMEDICQEFTRPKEVKITVVTRCPWLADADVVMTNDGTFEVIAAIRKLEDDVIATGGGVSRFRDDGKSWPSYDIKLRKETRCVIEHAIWHDSNPPRPLPNRWNRG